MALKLQNLAMDVLHLLDFQGLLPFYYFQTCAHMSKELKRKLYCCIAAHSHFHMHACKQTQNCYVCNVCM